MRLGRLRINNSRARCRVLPVFNRSRALLCQSFDLSRTVATMIDSSFVSIIDEPVIRPTDQRMEKEVTRLETFAGWPKPYISPDSLASAGFYYTNIFDKVCCAFCELEHHNWGEHDDPREVHETRGPTCEFVRGRFGRDYQGRNVPITEEERRITTTFLRYPQVRRYSNYGIKCREGKEESLALSNFGIVERRNSIPRNAIYADESERLKTFKRWPKALKQRPRELCEAGFFYSGYSDRTECFQCGIVLHNWEENDDPWAVHAKHAAYCTYLVMKRPLNATNPRERDASCTASHVGEPRNTEKLSKTGTNATKSTCCKLCFLNERAIVVLPCSHLTSCVSCAPKLTRCAVCGSNIYATLRVFPVD